MKLNEYYKKVKTTRLKFAKRLRVSPVTVYRWETGRRFPRSHIGQIKKETAGAVTANDFLHEDAT